MAINFGDDFAIKLGFKLEDIRKIMPELNRYIDKLNKDAQFNIKLGIDSKSTKNEFDKIEKEVEKAQSRLSKKLGNMKINPKKNFVTDDMLEQIRELEARLKNLGSIKGLDNVKNEIKAIGTEVENLNSKIAQNKSDATDKNNSVIGKFIQNSRQFADWYVTARVITEIAQASRQAVGDIIDMNTALTDLGKVVDMTNSQMEDMKDSAVQIGKDISKSSIDIMGGMAEIGRVTKDLDEIKDVAFWSGVASNVTDLSSAEASKGFVTITKQMGLELENVSTILDQMNEIQNNYRTSAEDLISGISKVGATARIAGVDITQLEGQITALVNSTGNTGDEIGTALNSIISRIYRVGSEGVESEGKPEKALNSIGVAVRDVGGEFRNYNDILMDTKDKWDTLSKAEQIYVAQQVGGTHHYQKFIGLMENYDDAINATNIALNSQGSAMAENERVVDSFQGKLNRIKTNMQESAFNSLEDSTVKMFLNLGVGITDVIGKIGLLKIAMVTFFTWAGSKISSTKTFSNLLSSLKMQFLTLSKEIQATGTSASLTTVKTNLLKTSLAGLKAILSSLGGFALKLAGGIALTFLIEKTMSLIDNLVNAKQKAKELNDELASNIKTTSNDLSSVDPLLAQQTDLKSKLSMAKSVEEQTKYKQQLLEVQKQIAEILPESALNFSDEADAIDQNTESIKQAIQAKKEKAIQDAKDIANSNEYKYLEARIKSYDEMKRKVEEIQESINNGTEMTVVRRNNMGQDEEIKLSIKEQEEMLNDYQGKMKETEETAKSYKVEVINMLRGMGVSDNEISELGLATDAVDRFTKALIENAKKQKDYQEESLSLEDSIKNIKDALNNSATIEKETDNFKDSTKKIQQLQGFIDEINKNGLSGNTALSIVDNFSELASVLDDDTALMEGLNNKIKEQEAIQEKAYEVMMGNDTTFYNNKIKNNDEFAKTVNDFLGMFVDENGNAYTVDLNNFDNYNSMKADTLGKLQDGVNRFLSQFVDENGNSYRVDLSNFTNLAEAKVAILDKLNQQIKVINKNMGFAQNAVESYKRMGSYGLTGESAFMDKYLSQLESQKNLVNGYIEDINKNIGAGLEIKGFTPKSLSSGQFHSGSASKDKYNNNTDKKIEDMEKLSDRYYALNNALQRVNNELEKNNQLLSNSSGEDRIKLERERIDLLHQQIKAQQDLRAEKEKEAKELKEQLANNGFNFDSSGNLTNESYIDSLVGWANSQNSKEAQENVKNLAEMIKKYTQITLNDIPKIESGILGIKNDIISAQKDIADVLKKQRDDRIQSIKDVTEETKKAIQEQKDAYNKAFEEDDFEDKLKDEQDKLNELQANLLDAQRMGDEERIKLLRKQIEEQRKVINTDIRDKEKEDANDRFDKELSDLDEKAQQKIDEINKKLSDEEILKMVQAGVLSLDEALNNIENTTKTINDTFIGVGIAIEDSWQTGLDGILDTMTQILDMSEKINMPSGINGRSSTSGVVIQQPITIEGSVDTDTLEKLQDILKDYGEEISNKIWRELDKGYKR